MSSDDDGNPQVVIEESGQTATFDEGRRLVARLIRRGRQPNPPYGLATPDEMRAFYLDVADQDAATSVNDDERRSAADQRQQIVEATDLDLWNAYRAHHPPSRQPRRPSGSPSTTISGEPQDL